MNLKDWLATLQQRERLAVYAGAGALVLLVLYLALWAPFDSRARGQLAEHVNALRADYAWMQQAAPRVRALAGSAGGAQDGQSLLARVDSSAKQQQLGDAVKRLEPASANSVRVWLEQADFDQLVLWLETLTRSQGLRIESISIERSETPGRVTARLTLAGSA
jgi:general secretion pathway protein M